MNYQKPVVDSIKPNLKTQSKSKELELTSKSRFIRVNDISENFNLSLDVNNYERFYLEGEYHEKLLARYYTILEKTEKGVYFR